MRDVRDLLTNPICSADELGRPIPESPYAVSTCLPTWADAVGYEEREPHVINALAAGYPRFVYHPTCQELFDRCTKQHAGLGQDTLVLVSRGAAERFARYLGDRSGAVCSAYDLGLGGEHVVCFDREHASIAKEYWQHTGEGISARQADCALRDESSNSAEQAKQAIRRRLAACHGEHVADEDVLLFPTGMTAIYTLHRALLSIRPAGRAAQFGFPYVDTLKVLQKFGGGALFYPNDDATDLRSTLDANEILGLFTELPSNPLLLSPDMAKLRDLADHADAPLVIDDTIATCVNANLIDVADVLCTSLTKAFSGVGDVAGGALILNPKSPWADRLRAALGSIYEDTLFGPDAVVLEANSHDFARRVSKMNDSAERLADHLVTHPKIANVHYPKYRTPDRYNALKRDSAGFGGLMSIELRNPETCAPVFYDALRCCKGPNLGTNYTLVCPYTILAHYDELAWAESCGVSRWLIRVSVGLEPPEELITRFDEALDACD